MFTELFVKQTKGAVKTTTVEPYDAKDMAYYAKQEHNWELVKHPDPLRVFDDGDKEDAKSIVDNLYDNGEIDISVASEFIELAMRNECTRSSTEAFGGLYSALKEEDRNEETFANIVGQIWVFPNVKNPTLTDLQESADKAEKKAKKDKSKNEAKSKENSKDAKDTKAKDNDSKDKKPELTKEEKAEIVQNAATEAANKTVDQIIHDIKGSEDTEEFRRQFKPQEPQIVENEPKAANVRFDASKFVNNKPQATVVTPQQMTPQGPTLKPITPQQAMQDAANTAKQNAQNIKAGFQQAKLDLENAALDRIVTELVKNYKFIPGRHEFNRDNLKNLYHMAHFSPFVKAKLKELNSTCRPNNPQFIEIDMPPMEQGGDVSYPLAFKVASKDREDILVLMDPTTVTMPDGRPSYRMQIGKFGVPLNHPEGCDCDDCKAEEHKDEETVKPATKQSRKKRRSKKK